MAASRRLYFHHCVGESDRAAVLDWWPAPAVRPETARQRFQRPQKMGGSGADAGLPYLAGRFYVDWGEWFGMWMSQQWNGVPSAFRFFVTIILVLIYLVQRDGELDE
ncbi:DUF2165 family protein [Serratia marcescens]